MCEPGSQVRIKSDPGRVGVLTKTSRQRGPVVLRLVAFPDGPQFIPEDELMCDTLIADPLELLEKGQLGRSVDLRRNLTHIRLSGRLANLIYSMDTTNTDFYPYQFKPVIRFLDSPSNGLLIADEVGLGKTIEAGLIWTELRSRIDARRLMVVCPSMLREKWQTELRQRFGINAQILDAAEFLSHIENSIADRHYSSFAVVTSLQGIRPHRGWRKAENGQGLSHSSKLARFLDYHANEEPLIDLLVIDEAHYMRNPETMSSEVGRLLRHVSEHVILLSATPIHLRNQDLYQLLNIVDEDTFNQPLVFDSLLEANAPLVEMRDEVISRDPKAEKIVELLNRAIANPYLENNRQLSALLEDPPTADLLKNREYRSELAFRLETMNLLSNVVNRTRKREVNEWRVLREAIPEGISLSPMEMEFYEAVTNLVREYCAKHNRQTENFLLVMPQRQVASSMPAALRDWQQRGEEFNSQMEEDFGIGDEDPSDSGPLVQELISRAHELGDLQALWNNDSKFQRLLSVLRRQLKGAPDEKIILFSYFRPTLRYLEERLSQEGIKCGVLMGGGGLDKAAILENFEKPEGPNVLLSSEVASEGIDLQFSRMVINYDLPWNPMKIEQRIGRIDRLGQKAPKILIWNLFAENTIDARIYQILYRRLQIFERALGGLEGVLGDEVRKLTIELLSKHLTPEQEEERIEQTAQALVTIRKQEERLEEEAAKLIAHGDYILNQVRAARELNRLISSQDLWIYVRDFLQRHYPGCQLQQLSPDELIFNIDLTPEAKFALKAYLEKQRISEVTRLHHAISAPTRCKFENRVSSPRSSREEIISQFHPLIRFISTRINEMKESYYPAVSISLKKAHCPKIADGDYVFSIQRWSVEGIQQREQLHFAAIRMDNSAELLTQEDAELLVTTAAMKGEDWLAASNVVDLKKARALSEKCLDQSYQTYNAHVSQLRNENNDRADIQEKALQRHLENQLKILEEVREGHRRQSRDGLVKATEGKMQALRSRMDLKKLEINERRNLKARCDEMCVGIVRVT